MTKGNESRFARSVTLLAFALVGGVSLLLWVVISRVDRTVQLPPTRELAFDESLPAPLKAHISVGDKTLFATESEKKADGIAAIAAGNYASAITALNASLAENPNDPESFIYRSNARIGSESALTIAVAAPADDKSASLEILRGVAQAQADINRIGGIEGTPVRLLLIDDGNDVAIAKTIASYLIDNTAVLGVIGHYSSDVTLATAPIYEQGQLVTVTPANTSVDLSGISPYLYRTVPANSFAAAALAAYMLYFREDRTAAVFYDSTSELSGSLREEFERLVSAWGGKVIEDYDVVDSRFSAEVVANSKADVLMLAASPDLIAKSAEIIRANANAKPILGSDEVYDPYILRETGQNAQALTLAVPWHARAGATDGDFVESSQNLWTGDVSWRTATAYDAMRAIAVGLASDPSREGLKTALDDNSFSVDSATGPLVFSPSGDRRKADGLVQVKAGTRSGTGYDFVPFTPDR